MVVHAFNPSTWEAEVGESLQIRGQPGLQELVAGQSVLLHRETLSQKTKDQNKTKRIQSKETI